MAKKKNKKKTVRKKVSDRREPGQTARLGRRKLRSYAVGALPIVNRLLERIQLDRFLQDHVRRDGPRTQLPTRTGLLLLLRNLVFSREPVYGVGEWADRYAPDLVGLTEAQRERLNDDRLGRCLDRAYEEVVGGAVVAVMADLADDVTDIPRMLEKLREGYDLVSASRYIPRGSGEHANRFKHLLSRLLGKTLQVLIGLPTNDATNAYKMYRTDLLDKIGILKSDNYTTGLEITVKAFVQGLRIAEIPTVWRDRSRGQSHFRILQVAPEYIRWFLWAVWKGWGL